MDYQMRKQIDQEEALGVELLEESCSYGQIDIVHWLSDRLRSTIKLSPTCFDICAGGGRLGVLRLLTCEERKRCGGFTVCSVDSATTSGHLETVKFLLTRDAPCTSRFPISQPICC